MAITVFLAGVTSSVESFIADATVEVSQTFTNDIASFPVDRKSQVSDHVFRKNPTFRVVGVVTNHPVTEYESNLVGYNENRVERADKLLQELWRTGGVFTLLTEYNDFNFCVLKSYSTTFTAQSSEALEFTVDIEQVRLVSSEIVSGVYADVLETDAKQTQNGAAKVEPADIFRSLGVLRKSLTGDDATLVADFKSAIGLESQ